MANSAYSLFDVYQSLFQMNNDACFAFNAVGEFIAINEAVVELTGYSRDELQHLSFLPLLKENRVAEAMAHFAETMKGQQRNFDSELIHKDGSPRHLSISLVPVFTQGEIIGAIGIAKNIGAFKKLQSLLSEQQAILEMIAMGNPLQVILHKIAVMLEGAAGGAKSAIFRKQESKDKWEMQVSVSMKKDAVSLIQQTLDIEPCLIKEEEDNSAASEPYYLSAESGAEIYLLPVLDSRQEAVGLIALEFTEKKNLMDEAQVLQKAVSLTSMAIQRSHTEEMIHHMAYHDALTELPNRRYFMEKSMTALDRAKAADKPLAVLFLDLDRFKVINDSLGHSFGDQLLIQVADRLKSCLRPGDIPSRQGGDEFTVLLYDAGTEQARAVTERIMAKLSEPYFIGEQEAYVTPSIGISMFPCDSDSLEDLIIKADIAMYKAKRHGRSMFRFFEEESGHPSHHRFNLENDLRKAVERNEFVLHYQPIVDSQTEKMIGAETLVRWQHPSLGLLQPGEFISIAEETGLIVPIGEWILKEACRQAVHWQGNGFSGMEITINLSMRQFYDKNLPAAVQKALDETGLNPSKLTLEITESLTMDLNAVLLILYKLKKIGVKIAIDDFGTGYSSLNYFQKLPVDYVKIDRSFIFDLAKNDGNKNLVHTIIRMARTMGIKTVAEGVETPEQAEFLRDYHCDKAQGYYFGKPVLPHRFMNGQNRLLKKEESTS